jgi:hypothetical protein
VKAEHDPPRLLDDSAPESSALRAALRGARADLPSPDQLARLAARLPLSPPPGGGAPPPPAPDPAPTTLAVPSALGAPTLFGGVGLIFLAALALFAVLRPRAHDSSAHDDAQAAALAPLAASAQATALAPPGSPVDPGLASPGPAASQVAIPSPSAIAPSPSAQPLAALPAPSATPLAHPSASAAVATDAESEVALLQRAQAALGSSPAQALALADEHQRRFRGGILAQEREVIAINALVRLGRTGEARSRAARFLAGYPRSAHRPRLEALLPGVGEGVPAP